MAVSNQMISYRPGMDIGLGFNLLTGTTGRETAVVGTVAAVEGGHGQHTDTRCQITTEVTKLHEFLGVNVAAEGSYMGFSASAKVDFAEKCDFSSFSTYVVIQVRVLNPFESIREPDFSAEALQLLEKQNTDAFRRLYGDCFISGRQLGGEYYAVYQFTSTNEARKKSLSADVNVAWTTGVASAELHAKFQHQEESEHERVETHVYTYRDGAIREADLSLDHILETARAFPVEVANGEAVPFSMMIDSYDALKKPEDSLDLFKIQQKREVLAELNKKLVEFKSLRDDLSFMLAHLDDFMWPDERKIERSSLAAQLDEVTDAINDMTNRASACAEAGEAPCEFPPYDVGKFEVPVLRPRGGVPVVSLVGLRFSAIEFALDDTTRKYPDYVAAVMAQAEPGSPFVVLQPEQYDFVTLNGLKFVTDPPVTTGGKHWIAWTVEQSPADGTVATGDEIRLRLKRAITNHPPPP